LRNLLVVGRHLLGAQGRHLLLEVQQLASQLVLGLVAQFVRLDGGLRVMVSERSVCFGANHFVELVEEKVESFGQG
jgi:hypothetical protein